jgi:hypothetical protein
MEFQTNPKSRLPTRLVGWTLIVGGISMGLCFSNSTSEELQTLAPVPFLVGPLFGILAVLSVHHGYAASITEEGLIFRSFKNKSTDVPIRKVMLLWKDIMEIRRYKLENRLNMDATKTAMFLLVDQTVLAESSSYAWLFSDEFEAFWKEAIAKARQQNIIIKTISNENGTPEALPAGLPLFQLWEIGQPVQPHNFMPFSRIVNKEKR